MKRFGAAGEETLVVEDSSRGLTSAVAAGIDCAIVHNDFTQAQDFSQASHRIGSLIELKEIILRKPLATSPRGPSLSGGGRT